MRAWDAEAFIERALKSRGGVVVIGGISLLLVGS